MEKLTQPLRLRHESVSLLRGVLNGSAGVPTGGTTRAYRRTPSAARRPMDCGLDFAFKLERLCFVVGEGGHGEEPRQR
jgi:hypothetical protein